MRGGTRPMLEISILSTECCCEPKTALQSKVYFKNKTYNSRDIIEIFMLSDHELIFAEVQNKMLLWIAGNNALLGPPKDH